MDNVWVGPYIAELDLQEFLSSTYAIATGLKSLLQNTRARFSLKI